MNYETYEAGLNKVLEILKEDYARWSNRAGITNLEPPEYYVEEGRSYDKIVKVDRAQKMVVGFIVKKDNPKKGFFVGDMLKANTWSAPATNFVRGTIANEESIRTCVQWCSIG